MDFSMKPSTTAKTHAERQVGSGHDAKVETRRRKGDRSFGFSARGTRSTARERTRVAVTNVERLSEDFDLAGDGEPEQDDDDMEDLEESGDDELAEGVPTPPPPLSPEGARECDAWMLCVLLH